MTANVNPVTGIRYGVISINSLNPDLAQELYFGSDAVDVNYNKAYAQAKKEAEDTWDRAREEAEIAASELDGGMLDGEREAVIENLMVEAGACWTHWSKKMYMDRDEFVELELERFSDVYTNDSDCTHIEGVYEGVKYMIGSLGGAGLLWVIEGPIGYANRLCSPCVPGAADLDGGFIDGQLQGNAENPEETATTGYLCYVVPHDWLAEDAS